MNKLKEKEKIIKSSKIGTSNNFYSDESIEILTKEEIVGRIYFIRHGITEDEEEGNGVYVAQGSKAELSLNGKTEINEISEKLKDLGINEINTKIVYGDDTERGVQSAKIISTVLFGDRATTENYLISKALESSKKKKVGDKVVGSKNEDRLRKIAAMFIKGTYLIEKTRLNISSNNSSFNNFILIGHRTNKGAVSESKENKKRELIVDFGIETGNVIELDVSSSGEVIDYNKIRSKLNLRIDNYKNILDSLKGEEYINKKVIKFENKQVQIWELQNYINAYFRSKPKLFKKYLLSDNHDVRVFCIANLIQNGDYEIVKMNFQEIIKRESEVTLVKLVDFLFMVLDEGQSEQFVDALVENGNRVGSWLDEKAKKKKLELYLNYKKYTKYYIAELRKKAWMKGSKTEKM